MSTPTTEISELRKYELMVIFSGELLEAEFEKELGELRKLLQDTTKGITYEDSWGRRDMMFKIKKQRRGFYAIFNFNAMPQSIAEIRTTVKLNQAVLRNLLISLPESYVPGRYNEEVLPREAAARDSRRKSSAMPVARPVPVEKAATGVVAGAGAGEKPTVAGKQEEEQLKKVEKKLEQILENPDIDVL